MSNKNNFENQISSIKLQFFVKQLLFSIFYSSLLLLISGESLGEINKTCILFITFPTIVIINLFLFFQKKNSKNILSKFIKDKQEKETQNLTKCIIVFLPLLAWFCIYFCIFHPYLIQPEFQKATNCSIKRAYEAQDLQYHIDIKYSGLLIQYIDVRGKQQEYGYGCRADNYRSGLNASSYSGYEENESFNCDKYECDSKHNSYKSIPFPKMLPTWTCLKYFSESENQEKNKQVFDTCYYRTDIQYQKTTSVNKKDKNQQKYTHIVFELPLYFDEISYVCFYFFFFNVFLIIKSIVCSKITEERKQFLDLKIFELFYARKITFLNKNGDQKNKVNMYVQQNISLQENRIETQTHLQKQLKSENQFLITPISNNQKNVKISPIEKIQQEKEIIQKKQQNNFEILEINKKYRVAKSLEIFKAIQESNKRYRFEITKEIFKAQQKLYQKNKLNNSKINNQQQDQINLDVSNKAIQQEIQQQEEEQNQIQNEVQIEIIQEQEIPQAE